MKKKYFRTNALIQANTEKWSELIRKNNENNHKFTKYHCYEFTFLLLIPVNSHNNSNKTEREKIEMNTGGKHLDQENKIKKKKFFVDFKLWLNSNGFTSVYFCFM